MHSQQSQSGQTSQPEQSACYQYACLCNGGYPQQPTPAPTPVKKKKRFLKCVGMIFLGILIFFAGALSHYFSLDGEIRALIQVKNRIQREYYEQLTDEQFYDAVFGGINNLLDDYSGYLSPDEYFNVIMRATGKQIGIGVSFYANATGDDALKIVQVTGNSPAERLGLLAGERIVGYGANENELQTANSYDAFVDFISDYEEGETFCLRILSASEQERNVTIARESYLASYVTYRTNNTAYRFVDGQNLKKTTYGQPLETLDSQTAYIRLTGFNGKAAEEFALAMTAFRDDGMKNLVLDLRGNGGGYLDTMLEIASYLGKDAPYGAVAAIADYGEKRENFSIKSSLYTHYFQTDSRVCVLADSGTASASECLIGFMCDYGTISYGDICLSQRGDQVRTYGKGIMQTTYPLLFANGGAIKITTAKILWPVSGNCIHGRGVLVSDGTLQVAENPDDEAELRAAIDALFS